MCPGWEHNGAVLRGVLPGGCQLVGSESEATEVVITTPRTDFAAASPAIATRHGIVRNGSLVRMSMLVPPALSGARIKLKTEPNDGHVRIRIDSGGAPFRLPHTGDALRNIGVDF